MQDNLSTILLPRENPMEGDRNRDERSGKYYGDSGAGRNGLANMVEGWIRAPK